MLMWLRFFAGLLQAWCGDGMRLWIWYGLNKAYHHADGSYEDILKSLEAHIEKHENEEKKQA